MSSNINSSDHSNLSYQIDNPNEPLSSSNPKRSASKRRFQQNSSDDLSQMDNSSMVISENSLGLSPVKKFPGFSQLNFSYTDFDQMFKKEYSQQDKHDSINQENEDPSKEFSSPTININDVSFKSISKCDDLDLQENKNILNETFSPEEFCNVDSIGHYFKKYSEQLSEVGSLGMPVDKSNENQMDKLRLTFEKKMPMEISVSKINEPSFISLLDDISSSENTLDICKKVIKRLNDTKVDKFSPNLNSTLINCDLDKREASSGIGTATGYSSGKSKLSGNSPGNQISLTNFLKIGPLNFDLKLGCYVPYKINYLRICNTSSTCFKLLFKNKNTHAETMNNVYLKLPAKIEVLALSNEIISEEIIITPLNTGFFRIAIQVCPIVENLQLPFEPVTITCNINSENVIFHRQLLFPSKSKTINFHLFKEDDLFDSNKKVTFCISNEHLSGEIPLKFQLVKDSDSIMFSEMFNTEEREIIRVRCPDIKTLLLTTKNKFPIEIPLKIINDKPKIQSTLTVSIDSTFSHVIGVFHIQANFWPKNQLTESCLACSCATVKFRPTEWQKVDFRNQSKDKAISVSFCFAKKHGDMIKRISSENVGIISDKEIILPPQGKYSIGLMILDNLMLKHLTLYLHVLCNGGIKPYFQMSLPLQLK